MAPLRVATHHGDRSEPSVSLWITSRLPDVQVSGNPSPTTTLYRTPVTRLPDTQRPYYRTPMTAHQYKTIHRPEQLPLTSNQPAPTQPVENPDEEKPDETLVRTSRPSRHNLGHQPRPRHLLDLRTPRSRHPRPHRPQINRPHPNMGPHQLGSSTRPSPTRPQLPRPILPRRRTRTTTQRPRPQTTSMVTRFWLRDAHAGSPRLRSRISPTGPERAGDGPNGADLNSGGSGSCCDRQEAAGARAVGCDPAASCSEGPDRDGSGEVDRGRASGGSDSGSLCGGGDRGAAGCRGRCRLARGQRWGVHVVDEQVDGVGGAARSGVGARPGAGGRG